MLRSLLASVRFNDDGDWTVVDQTDLHMCPENSSLHVESLVPESCAYVPIDLICIRSHSRTSEAGPVAASHISIERKLADDEKGAFDVCH